MKRHEGCLKLILNLLQPARNHELLYCSLVRKTINSKVNLHMKKLGLIFLVDLIPVYNKCKSFFFARFLLKCNRKTPPPNTDHVSPGTFFPKNKEPLG